jgi:hypothetical protein
VVVDSVVSVQPLRRGKYFVATCHMLKFSSQNVKYVPMVVANLLPFHTLQRSACLVSTQLYRY